MLDNFWESIGSKLADRWVEYIFGPAFLFWAGCLGVYGWVVGWQTLMQEIEKLTPIQQGGWLILVLFILISSSMLVGSLRFPILRLLEGYWFRPFNYLGLGLVALIKPRFQKNNAELHRLAAIDENKLDAWQRERLNRLERFAHWHPVKADDLLPTSLGNILRAREQSPKRKYGLDTIICWPRLWPLLPENVRADLAIARSTLDRLMELWFWGGLSLLWAYWIPWTAIISLFWMIITYEIACQVSMSYGELLEASFDLHRFSLYDAMGWYRPKSTEEEEALGTRLTEYLWRGTLPTSIKYRGEE